MDQAGELLVRLQAEGVGHARVEGKPAGEPASTVAERGGCGDDIHGTGARRQFLLPGWHLWMQLGEANNADHQRRVGEPLPLDLDLAARSLRVLFGEDF